ncbi:aminoglycoside phosphotransferase (APT) family kinase protein [Streptomyces sp. PanSC19]|uniref:phosphotransferase family protein n=1 Tax=Streptomyces sp. PanSC19 TaxID=1520455 RepID=UPI000FBFE61B|nr:phosphotransferase family protein [Streptomyces sp. PanSC19]ROQ35795.1 aminoglycoside phosphotransferase (APT) family kinase protein [Streptomyces sp. PanSC19]
MHTVPDGVEVVASREEARRLDSPPLLVLDAVTGFLDAHGIGHGPLAWQRIGDGHSNVTYLIERGNESVVLRRGPRPPLPKSTHDMVREARIQKILGGQGVPVPEILAVCEDETVLGVPFYLMSRLDGTVVTDTIPAHLSPAAQRRATSEAVVDTLVALHAIDVTEGELASLGRPEGYLGRQVERFRGLWDVNTTRDLPAVERIADWLARNLPASQAASVVHGDYRMGNLMFAPQAPARVLAILDWEMATLGDPLADLGYLTATWSEAGHPATPLELTRVTRSPGYLTRRQLAERYQHRTGLDLTPLPWYQTLALWKAAIFCEAIHTRWQRGERPNDTVFGPSLETGVPRLLGRAGRYASLTATTRR